MRLPENLSLPMVADVMAALGVPVDRGNVGRALRNVVIDGVEAPDGPGCRWRVPRAKLTDAVAACLHRRQRRSHDRWNADLERCRLAAAELMTDHDELARFVPRPLARVIADRREEKRRLRTEAERREREGRERQAREARARRLEHERRERERHEKTVMDWAYSHCFHEAYKAIGAPTGGDRFERPEFVQLRLDFPSPRPSWWLPPPGMYQAVAEDLPKHRLPDYVEPGWSRWVPPYEPGKPWPWHAPEPADAAAG